MYNCKFKVTSPFGARMLNGKTEHHNGIDLVSLGDKHIISDVSGRVVASQIVHDKQNRTWEWGNYVCILGIDGYYYYYCHLKTRLVVVGDRVEYGDHIGIEGNTGYSFGDHCHFEVRDKNHKSINPAPFIGIPNEIGTYGRDYRGECKVRFSLSDATMQYLDGYTFAGDLYRKLMK